MIYTVTLNPALDYVIQVDHFTSGQINRTKQEYLYYGGKGINVSTILKELNMDSCALGFIAGFTGEALKKGLENQDISTDLILVKEGMTRINVKMKSDEETEINGRGPSITEADFKKLIEKVKNLKSNDMLVLSGSIPSCMPNDTYEQIIRKVPHGVCVIVDAEKELLLKVLKYKPFLIKPNHLELAQIFGVEMKSTEDIIHYALELQKRGAQNVIVSCAENGAILVDEHGNVHIQKAAKGEVINSVGAGDSMVAGFIAGLQQNHDYPAALKLGTACGGATAFHFGLATRQEIEKVLSTL